MNLKNKLIIILLIIFCMLSFSTVVFGKYIIETDSKEITNINIKGFSLLKSLIILFCYFLPYR